MNRTNRKTRVLRFIWGIIPWMIVGLVVAFVVIMAARITEKKTNLEEAKKGGPQEGGARRPRHYPCP